MTKDSQPTINLEITVPRIVLPSMHEETSRSQPVTKSQQVGESEQQVQPQAEEEVRVQVLPLSSDEREEQNSSAEVFIHNKGVQIFRLFRFLQQIRHGTTYLSKILHTHKKNGPAQTDSTLPSTWITEALLFRVEYRSIGADKAQTGPIRLLPGVNQVVIYLDEEDTPTSYSIDGSES